MNTIAILIDADNISPAAAEAVFNRAAKWGEPIIRRAYGMVNCFSSADGWTRAQREYGIVARPQVSNVSGKNVADIALVVDAMEFLYKSPCQGICIVSSDSDFTALAARIREGGKSAYGIGSAKTPESFRRACSEFFELPQLSVKQKQPVKKVSAACPRCNGKMEDSRTKSGKPCKICATCGGVAAKATMLNDVFAEESVVAMIDRAKEREQPGCICPDCGETMSIVKVASGKKSVEIDVCGKCHTIWYDKGEFEALLPGDKVLVATVSAGKAYRREMVLALAADLRSGRCKVADIGALKTILKKVYHVPAPDIQPIIGTLSSQRIVKVDKTGHVSLFQAEA